MTNQVQEVSETIEAGGAYGKALVLAHLNTPLLNSAAITAANAKDEFSGAPIKLYMAMKNDISEDVLDSLPMVGSKGDNNPALFMWKDPNSDAKEREVDFYHVWADNTPEGLKVTQEMKWNKALSNPETMRQDDIPADYKEKYAGPASRDARKKYLTGRRTTIRNCYKKAVQLMHQIEAMCELAGVTAKVMPGAEPGTYENFIHVFTKNEERKTVDTMHLSIGTFLKLKPLAIAEQGGTYAAMKASITRAPKKAGDKEQPGIPALTSIETPETFDKVGLPLATYLDHIINDKKGKKYGDFLKFLTGPGGGSTIEMLAEMRSNIDQIFNIDKVSFIYAKLQEQIDTDDDEKAA